MNERKTTRDLAVLVGVAVLFTLPFLNQAFHIDDGLWIDIAGIISKNPLKPYSPGEYNYLGKLYSGTLYSGTHPLLIPYFMALLLHLGGDAKELVFHGAFLAFPLLAAVAFYAISARFCRNPLSASLLFLSAPAFVLMAHTVMLDMPLLAFWLGSVAAFLRGAEKGSASMLALSALFSTLSVFTAYQGLSLAPLLLALAALKGWISRRSAAAALAPAALFLLWAIPSFFAKGSFPLSAAYSHVRPYGEAEIMAAFNIGSRLISSLAGIGGVMVSAPLVVYLALFAARLKTAYYAVLLLSFAAYLLFARDYSEAQVFLLLVFLSAAGVLIYSMAASAFRPQGAVSGGSAGWNGIFRRGGDDMFLLLWLSGVLFYSVFFMPWGAARYLLPALAPGVIHLCRLAERCTVGRKTAALLLGAAVLNGVISIGLSKVDNYTASIYRELPKKLDEMAQRGKVWFVGDWGFRHYLEERGYEYLLSDDDSPGDGDIVVVTNLAVPHKLSKSVLLRMAPYTAIEYNYRLPLRLISERARAGFYSHGWGYLPYSFSRDRIDKVEIFKIIDLGEFSLSSAKISAPDPTYVGLKSLEIGGERRVVIFAHPPSAITYQLDLPARSKLSFSVATDPNVWDMGVGDGVVFEVWVSVGEGRSLVYRRYIDAKSNPPQRRWHDQEVDLSRYGGMRAALTLRTTPGPAGDARFDGAAWSDLRISNSDD